MNRFLLPALLLVSVSLPVRAQAVEDRTSLFRDILVAPGETVGDATCFYCAIHVRGTVEGDATALGGSIDIDGVVEADVTTLGGDIRLGPRAKVGGGLDATGGRVEQAPGAIAHRDVDSEPLPILGRLPALPRVIVLGLIVGGALNLVLALTVYTVARRRRIETITGTVRARAGLSLLTGLGVVAIATVLYTISAYTGRLTPWIAGLVSIVLVITLALGFTGISSWLGSKIAPQIGPLKAVVLGALVLAVINSIPLLGLMTIPVTSLFALGGAALSRYGSRPRGKTLQPFGSPQPVPLAMPPSGA